MEAKPYNQHTQLYIASCRSKYKTSSYECHITVSSSLLGNVSPGEELSEGFITI